jgi:ribonuclease R
MKKGSQKLFKITRVISVNSKGIGSVETDGEKIEIYTSNLNTALHNDLVEVYIYPKVPGKQTKGEVSKIIERAKTKFVGTIEKNKRACFVIPDDRRFYTDIFIPPKYAINTKNNQKVYVEISQWQDPAKNPEGKILKVIGQKGQHETEILSILLNQGIEYKFPKIVEDEAKEIERRWRETQKELSKKETSNHNITSRADFRNVTTMTIDPETAKDFDDALSVRKLRNGNTEIGVHIADVSHFVKLGGEIDKEANDRKFSVYLVDRTIPMLPEILSNNLCSLNPNEDRFAFSVIFEFTNKGEILSTSIQKTIINSNKRFSYKEAQKILDGQKGEMLEELNTLNHIAKVLQKNKRQRGAINFSKNEVEFRLDKHGRPIKIYKKKQLETNSLIEEYMILANREVAKFVHQKTVENKKSEIFVFRVHDFPKKDALEPLSIFLKILGYKINMKDKKSMAKNINNVLKKSKGKPEEHLISEAILRTMSKARYSTKNIGHFGLALKFYSHFTSPIRRYPDLVAHRLISTYISNKYPSRKTKNTYEKIMNDASEKEIQVTKAERDSIKYKQVEYMSKHIGKVFDGIVSGVKEWGIFVEEQSSLTEGLVSLRSLKNDFYVLDEKTYSLIGQRKKGKIRLGDKVKIKVVKTDIERKTVDYEMVD